MVYTFIASLFRQRRLYLTVTTHYIQEYYLNLGVSSVSAKPHFRPFWGVTVLLGYLGGFLVFLPDITMFLPDILLALSPIAFMQCHCDNAVVRRHEEKKKTMKKDELNKLKLKDFLPVVYDDIEPHLIAELNRLREELISLPEDTDEKEILLRFENSVKNLNKIDQDKSIESGIDTEEREGLCDALYTMGEIVGISEDDKYLDEWRDW